LRTCVYSLYSRWRLVDAFRNLPLLLSGVRRFKGDLFIERKLTNLVYITYVEELQRRETRA
jgi:hypothetical protein